MEFLEFIDAREVEIIKLVEQAGYEIEENNPLCSLSEKYVGFLNKRKKKLIICTDNAKRKAGHTNLISKDKDTFERAAIYIKKGLRHEAVHVAQECNEGNLLDIDKKFTMKPSKINAFNGSVKISGEYRKERQAYILEDRPKLVEKELKKYCL